MFKYIILVIMLIIVVGGLFITFKVRNVMRSLFGTSDLKKINDERIMQQANTPKSVSGATKIYLPKITNDFPEFQYEEMRNQVEWVLTSYLRAITEKKTAIDGVSDAFNADLCNHVMMLESEGITEHYGDIKVHKVAICDYKKEPGRCVITFQAAVGCIHYITDSNMEIKEGFKDIRYQTRYNLELEYIQNVDMLAGSRESVIGVNCPNCGAPISKLGLKTCEYCGTAVREINLRVWKFSDIRES